MMNFVLKTGNSALKNDEFSRCRGVAAGASGHCDGAPGEGVRGNDGIVFIGNDGFYINNDGLCRYALLAGQNMEAIWVRNTIID